MFWSVLTNSRKENLDSSERGVVRPILLREITVRKEIERAADRSLLPPSRFCLRVSPSNYPLVEERDCRLGREEVCAKRAAWIRIDYK